MPKLPPWLLPISMLVVGGIGVACSDTMEPTVLSVEITPKPIEVEVGRTVEVTATYLAQGGMLAGRTVSWESSAPAVATVARLDRQGLSANVGLVTGVAP